MFKSLRKKFCEIRISNFWHTNQSWFKFKIIFVIRTFPRRQPYVVWSPSALRHRYIQAGIVTKTRWVCFTPKMRCIAWFSYGSWRLPYFGRLDFFLLSILSENYIPHYQWKERSFVGQNSAVSITRASDMHLCNIVTHSGPSYLQPKMSFGFPNISQRQLLGMPSQSVGRQRILMGSLICNLFSASPCPELFHSLVSGWKAELWKYPSPRPFQLSFPQSEIRGSTRYAIVIGETSISGVDPNSRRKGK